GPPRVSDPVLRKVVEVRPGSAPPLRATPNAELCGGNRLFAAEHSARVVMGCRSEHPGLSAGTVPPSRRNETVLWTRRYVVDHAVEILRPPGVLSLPRSG